ncbi:MAG: TRAP transporter large permease subunit [Pusillimonas sp.]|nr:MAG: TRAP transporter large permease subunit [Pusillimonas sp.]
MVTMLMFMPAVAHFGYDPIWFSIIMLLGLQIGLVPLPFGMELFVMQGVAPKGTSMLEIVKSGLPYLVCALFVILAIMVCPGIVTIVS